MNHSLTRIKTPAIVLLLLFAVAVPAMAEPSAVPSAAPNRRQGRYCRARSISIRPMPRNWRCCLESGLKWPKVFSPIAAAQEPSIPLMTS